MGFSIKAVPIFSVGEWNGKDFTRDDLNAMCSSHYKLKAAYPGWRPHLKVTHDDDTSNKLLSAASAGEMSNFQVVGDFLVADFHNIPDGLRPFIANGSFARRSIELSPFWMHKGEVYTNVVRACAFLGSEMPAVGSLQDVAGLFGFAADKDIETIEYSQSGQDEVKLYQWDLSDSAASGQKRESIENRESTQMSEQDKTFSQADVDALVAKAAEEALKKFKAEQEQSAAAQQQTAAQEAAAKDIDAQFSKLAEEGKLVPAQAEMFAAIAKKDAGMLEPLKALAGTFNHSVLKEGAATAVGNTEAFKVDMTKCPDNVTKTSFALNAVAEYFQSKDAKLSLKDAMLKAEKSAEFKAALEGE